MSRENLGLRNQLVYTIMVLIYVFAFTEKYMMVCIGLTFLCFLICRARLVLQRKTIGSLLIFMGLMPFTSLLFVAVPSLSGIVSLPLIRKEIIRATLYILILSMASSLAIEAKFFYKLWNFTLYFIVGIAVIQYLHIFDVTSVLRKVYGDTRQFYNLQYSDLSRFRSGSVFINPNDLASYLVAALTYTLVISREFKLAKLKRILPIGTVIVGLILAGSRTGLIATLVILAAYMWEEADRNLSVFISSFLKIVFLASIAFVVIGLLRGEDRFLSSLRLFSVAEGRQSSIGVKLEHYYELIKNMNPINYLIGYGPYDYTSNYLLEIDFDFGYLTTYYGLLGFAVFILFLRRIKSYGNIYLKGRKLMNLGFIILYFIFSLTAGVYFNIRIFAIQFLMFTPMIMHDGEMIA